jgi:chromosome segregation ATPase
MGELVLANLELHEELSKQVPINLENEAKIKRLERQQARYEEDIQSLHNIIEKLESQKGHSEKEVSSLNIALKNSEKLCSEKEKFILFRESQLSESENTINELKQQILALSSNMSRSRSRSRSNSQTRADIISLETLSSDRLVEEVNNSAEELYQYAVNAERLQNVRIAEHLRNRIARALELVEDEIISKEELIQEVEDYRKENHRLNESLQGAHEELLDTQAMIEELEGLLGESRNQTDETEGDLRNLSDEIEGLEGNRNTLIREYQRALNAITVERDELQRRMDGRRRFSINAITRLDQNNIRLRREMGILRIQNQWRLNRLINLPPVIPPPIQQQPDQIWLLFH